MDDNGEDEAGSIASYSTATGILELQHLNDLILEDDELLSLQETIEGLPDPILRMMTQSSLFSLLQRGVNNKSTQQDESESSDDDDDGLDQDQDKVEEYRRLCIYTLNEILLIGLRLVGFTEFRINWAKTSTNIEHFKAHYGSNPMVCALIWQDLQETELKVAWVPPSKRNLKHFVMVLHHLKCYPTEFEREAIFDISLAYG
jgi:hypothetical protein